jgi:hypothetical protein
MRTGRYALIIVGLVLGLYGIYSIFAALRSGLPYYAVAGAVALTGAVGLFVGWRWSRLLVYLLALAIAGSLLYPIWGAVRSGYFIGMPTLRVIVSLIPAALILFLCVCCSYVVFSHFRQLSRGT